MKNGLMMLGGAVAVFVICSLVQGAGGSSMFSTSYYEPDSWFLNLMMNVTFWPGWLLTGYLVFAGVSSMFSKDEGSGEGDS